MNDEASSSAAGLPPPDRDAPSSALAAPTATELAERRKRNLSMFSRKRGELLDDVLRNLDILVYAELSTVYYMDCSFFRFAFRAFSQFILLTPKPTLLPDEAQHRPGVGVLFFANAVCLFCHIWFDAPSAGEATRGYMHGGLAMDFIGQKGPSSKIRLVLLDVLILALQLVMFASSMLRKRVRDASKPSSTAQPTTASSETAQDLDSEERGIRRSQEAQDIEMQRLNASGASAAESNDTDSSDRESLLANTAYQNDTNIFDAFHSGQIMIADLDIWKTLKDHADVVKNMRNSPPTIDGIRHELAQRAFRMRLGTDAIRQTL